MALPENEVEPINEVKEEAPNVSVRNITLTNKMGFLQIKTHEQDEHQNILLVVEG